jgi:hypothetical protein
MEGGKVMSKRISVVVGTVLFFALIGGFLQDVVAAPQQDEAMITVLNPRGKPPSITLVPLAPRPVSLEGKTVYFVDSGFPTAHLFMKELQSWFGKNMPQVKTEFRQKIGSFFDDDPKLWAEIKEKKGVVVLGVGH